MREEQRRAAVENRKERGMTLFEVAIAAILTVVLLGGATSAVLTFHGAFTETTAAAVADETLRLTLERLVSELGFAQADSVVLSSATDARELTFSTVLGWENDAQVLSPPHQITFSNRTILLDGNVIADGIRDFTANLDNNLLTIAIAVDSVIAVNGSQQTIDRQGTVAIRL